MITLRADVVVTGPPYAERVRWWERVAAWDDTHRLAVDAAGAAVLALVVLPPATVVVGFVEEPGLRLWSLALVVPLAWRRVRPVGSAAAVLAVVLAHLLSGVPFVFPADLLVLLSLYSVTVHGPRWAYLSGLGSAFVGSGAFGLALLGSGAGIAEASTFAFIALLLCVTAFTIGLVRRSRRVTIDALVDRARRLEVERDQEVRLATAGERTRIAREMHDIVAHSLSVIIAQADGGRYAAQADPQAATRSLTTIAETGRAALADMRRLLGVLRPDEQTPDTDRAAAGPSVAALTPQPAVEDVAELVAGIRSSGVQASLVRMGAARPLPPGTGLTVYRICQEALTNVLKHAGPDARTTVLLQWTPTSVVLEVTDDGRGAAADSDGRGQGVLGMRERAAMLGGTLSVGPRPGGGFRVRAEIPTPPVEVP